MSITSILKKFLVRKVCASDEEHIKSIASSEYIFKHLYEVDPTIGDKVYWEQVINAKNDINFFAFMSTGELLGRVALQGIEQEIPELAIVIVKEKQGNNYYNKSVTLDDEI